jgi:hypothetical protein
VVRKVGDPEEHKVSRGLLEAVAVGGAQTQLALARQDHDLVLAVDLLQLARYLQRPVGAVVLHDHDLIL